MHDPTRRLGALSRWRSFAFIRHTLRLAPLCTAAALLLNLRVDVILFTGGPSCTLKNELPDHTSMRRVSSPSGDPIDSDVWSTLPSRGIKFNSEQVLKTGTSSIIEQCGSIPKYFGSGEVKYYQFKMLVQPNEVKRIFEYIASTCLFATEPDSVDGMPSHEFYPFANGQWIDESAKSLLSDIIAHRVLPLVRERYSCPACALANVLIRRYLPGERRTHAVHFDKQAFVTAVLGLSDPNAYEGGLFLQPGPTVESRLFPRIDTGDVFMHSYDLQHGVHVYDGVRYSLVMWFKDSEDAARNDTTPWLHKLAAEGDVHALHLLAESFEFGEFGADQNPQLALQLHEQSAEAGHYCSQASLGFMYQQMATEAKEVSEVVEFMRKSMFWLQKAAQGGWAEAQRALAIAYLDGAAAGYDDEQAAVWMRQAADQLDIEASYELGKMYRNGVGLPEDREEARKWLKRSLNAGFQPAQAELDGLQEDEFDENTDDDDDLYLA